MHWGDIAKIGSETFGPLVLGIDPVPAHAPSALSCSPDTFLESYTALLLDAAAGKTGFVKFQSAYFEAWGRAGIASLSTCIAMAKERGFAVILDAKRGDIGSTAEAYAHAYLTPGKSNLEVDCLTISPFLGPETLEPFVDCARKFGKGLFVLVKTSNPGSGWMQDQIVDGMSISERVARLVAAWAEETVGNSGVGAVGAVVGATYPDQGLQLRQSMPKSAFLAPGLGAQGAEPSELSALATPLGPVLVAASRGIAAVDDLDMSVSSYAELVRGRIDAFCLALGSRDSSTS